VRRMPSLLLAPLAAALALAALVLVVAPLAAAEQATWSGAEQPVPSGSSWPVGLGKIGDIEFWAPNRGLLITEGQPPTIPPGVWAYNGVEWHEIADVCGATDGRIAWASPSEFWTVSDGRAGQANEVSSGGHEVAVPHEDNTLCHFARGEVVDSYAHPANQADSYQAMHAAACLGAADCWFGGDPLPEPQIGAFHLHWNGGSLENEPYLGEGHAVEDMRSLAGHLFESVQVNRGDHSIENEAATPVLHRINPEGVHPAIEPEEGLFGELPLYEQGELASALSFLRLSAASGTLWAAAGKSTEIPEAGHQAGQVTLALGASRSFTQVIGPEHPLAPILPANRDEEHELLDVAEAKEASVSALAAEPGTGDAWLALAPPEGLSAQKRAVLLHVSSEGEVLEERTLPSVAEEEEGIGPKGAAAKLACPQAEDCWLATTQGWLFHLAPEGGRTLPRDAHESEYFTGLITYRPPDQGLPQVPPDAPPPDDSGLVEAPPDYGGTFAETSTAAVQQKVTLPLLSRVHSRLHGYTLELRFHLAVRARVRLIAKRRRKVVAQTPMRTLTAGSRKLLLKLNPRHWPTKLSLQTHALAPLPRVSSASGEGAGVNTETTGLFVLPRGVLLGSGPLR
jgi:hypothetical protein